MIHMLAYNPQKQELDEICNITRNQAALLTNDVLNIKAILLRQEYQRFMEANPVLDVICFDITQPHGISDVENLRRKYAGAYVILLADMTISPVKYMKPSIMAASLLLRPFAGKDIEGVITDMFNVFQNEDDSGNVFLVEDENGRNRIPYGDILYFESREKKIYVCTAKVQYGFYDTIERLASELPDQFRRCHRSYIVNSDLIQKVVLSENMVYLEGDYTIPVSRSYRNDMKEFKHGK